MPRIPPLVPTVELWAAVTMELQQIAEADPSLDAIAERPLRSACGTCGAERRASAKRGRSRPFGVAEVYEWTVSITHTCDHIGLAAEGATFTTAVPEEEWT